MQRKLKIYYTSDTHGFFSPVDYATGGMTAGGLANCMNNFCRDGNTLIIDGGDTLQGSPFTYWLYSQHLGGDCVPAKVLNLGGYDFITLGNHDFNYGAAEIERFLAALDAKCLCTNVEGVKGIEKYAVVTLENGLRVGLTGVVTHYVNRWEKPENLRGIRISDAFSAASDALDALKEQSPDITVCIYHGGYEKDLKTGAPLSATDENQGCRICNELDFDVLLCAHQHMPAADLCIGGTYTCQPPDKARQYIDIDVTVGENGVDVRSALCPAGDAPLPAAMDYIAPLEAETAKWLDTPVGHLDTALSREPPLEMAAHGSLIANFFNQVQLEASGADISSTSLANTVKGFERDVTIRDVVSTYIFPNTLVTLRVDRHILKAAMERCAEYFSLGEGHSLCVSETFLRPILQHFNYDYFAGINAVYDLRRPIGDRVVSIKYRGEELPDDKKLSICMNNYRASGAGGYAVFRDAEVVCEQQTEISELIIDYITRHRNIIVDKTKWLEIVY